MIGMVVATLLTMTTPAVDNAIADNAFCSMMYIGMAQKFPDMADDIQYLVDATNANEYMLTGGKIDHPAIAKGMDSAEQVLRSDDEASITEALVSCYRLLKDKEPINGL